MVYITPEKAVALKIFSTLEEARRAAASGGKCVCGRPVWRLAQTGLCFSCTTGSSDSSDDYELKR